MLSIFTASTRVSEDTGSPANGDRNWDAGVAVADAFFAGWLPRSASSAPATRAARTTTAATTITVLYRTSKVLHLGHFWQKLPRGNREPPQSRERFTDMRRGPGI